MDTFFLNFIIKTTWKSARSNFLNSNKQITDLSITQQSVSSTGFCIWRFSCLQGNDLSVLTSLNPGNVDDKIKVTFMLLAKPLCILFHYFKPILKQQRCAEH